MRFPLLFALLPGLAALPAAQTPAQDIAGERATRRNVLEALGYINPETGRERGYLGVYMEVRQGVMLVLSTLAGGPGAEAGIEPGDRVLRVHEHEVATNDALKAYLIGLVAGQPVSVRVERDGWVRDLDLDLVSRDELYGDDLALYGGTLAWTVEEPVPSAPIEAAAPIEANASGEPVAQPAASTEGGEPEAGDELEVFTRSTVVPAVAGEEDYFDPDRERDPVQPIEAPVQQPPVEQPIDQPLEQPPVERPPLALPELEDGPAATDDPLPVESGDDPEVFTRSTVAPAVAGEEDYFDPDRERDPVQPIEAPVQEPPVEQPVEAPIEQPPVETPPLPLPEPADGPLPTDDPLPAVGSGDDPEDLPPPVDEPAPETPQPLPPVPVVDDDDGDGR